jgi:hypothetical protein
MKLSLTPYLWLALICAANSTTATTLHAGTHTARKTPTCASVHSASWKPSAYVFTQHSQQGCKRSEHYPLNRGFYWIDDEIMVTKARYTVVTH